MNRHLELIGVAMILLALAHVFSPKYFGWKKELASLSLLTRQMMYVHTAFIALAVLLMGVLCLIALAELMNTGLGRKISIGLAIFWGCRLLVQFFGYSPKLWRGKRFETSMHILFTLLWIYLTTIFAIIATGNGT
jgi:hypothetical protein